MLHVSDVINKAHKISKDLGDYNVIHLRAGDNVGFYINIRTVNERVIAHHGVYFELALAIIEKESVDKKFIIVSDNLTGANELARVINRENVFCVDKFRDSSTANNLELFFFDIVFMSNSKALYGTHSALVKIAKCINPNLTFHSCYQVFTKKRQYEFLALNYPRLKKFISRFESFFLRVYVLFG